MSHAALAALLGREDLPVADRLVALAVGTYAGGDQRAWPKTRTAAKRAGLAVRRCEEALERLIDGGEIVVEREGRGRGGAAVLRLVFAQSGPWWEHDVNVGLVETVLDRTGQTGPARLVLAAHAALADADGVVSGFTNDDLTAASGVADTTFRRARSRLQRSGELELLEAGGGRGRLNRWRVLPGGGEPRGPHTEWAPTGLARPLRSSGATRRPQPARGEPVGPSGPSALAGPARASSPRSQTPPLSPPDRSPQTPPLSRPAWAPETLPVSLPNGENPSQMGPETPPPYVRAWKEPKNPRTLNPPSPPEGGSGTPLLVEREITTTAGRRRRRLVTVTAGELCAGWQLPEDRDERAFTEILGLLRGRVSEEMFDVWLDPLELVAVNADSELMIVAPDPTRGWLIDRYGPAITAAAIAIGRRVTVADSAQAHAWRLQHPTALVAPAATAEEEVPTGAVSGGEGSGSEVPPGVTESPPARPGPERRSRARRRQRRRSHGHTDDRREPG